MRDQMVELDQQEGKGASTFSTFGYSGKKLIFSIDYEVTALADEGYVLLVTVVGIKVNAPPLQNEDTLKMVHLILKHASSLLDYE